MGIGKVALIRRSAVVAGGTVPRGFRRVRVVLACLVACVAVAAPASSPRYTWAPWLAPDGPVLIVVSLPEQRLVVYRNGIAIGDSTISSGRPGFATPAGTYAILGKEREHRSNLYDDAPMPFMQRLTWDGLALHAGTLPGHPASHGCIRLPEAFARELFAVTRVGDIVVVADAQASPALVHPALLAPLDDIAPPLEGKPAAGGGYWWSDDAAAGGTLSVVVSLADREVRAYRQGRRVGAAVLTAPETAFAGTVLFIAEAGGGGNQRVQPRHRWRALPLTTAAPTLDQLVPVLSVPGGFAQDLERALKPGDTVLVTDRSAAHDALSDCMSDTGNAHDGGSWSAKPTSHHP